MSKTSESSVGSPARLRGEFELNHQVEPLPPTEISGEAMSQLLEGGLLPSDIKDLQEFTASFRYDQVPLKMARLTATPVIEIFEPNFQLDRVGLPNFYDVKGRLDGQCVDVTRQWLLMAQLTGLVDTLTEHLQTTHPDRRLQCRYYNGLPDQHFITQGSRHVWAGLDIVDDQGIIASVYIDPTYQSIFTAEQSSYQVKATIDDVAQLTQASMAATLDVGHITTKQGELLGGTLGEFITLGISDDRQRIYSLNFVRPSEDPAKLIPIISLTYPNGEHFDFHWDSSHQRPQPIGPSPNQLSAEQYQELVAVLEQAQHFSYQPYQQTSIDRSYKNTIIADS